MFRCSESRYRFAAERFDCAFLALVNNDFASTATQSKKHKLRIHPDSGLVLFLCPQTATNRLYGLYLILSDTTASVFFVRHRAKHGASDYLAAHHFNHQPDSQRKPRINALFSEVDKIWKVVFTLEQLLFTDDSCDDPSAVAAGVVFGDCTHDWRAAAGTAILDDLLCKRNPQHPAVLFRGAAAQIPLFDWFYDFL